MAADESAIRAYIKANASSDVVGTLKDARDAAGAQVLLLGENHIESDAATGIAEDLLRTGETFYASEYFLNYGSPPLQPGVILRPDLHRFMQTGNESDLKNGTAEQKALLTSIRNHLYVLAMGSPEPPNPGGLAPFLLANIRDRPLAELLVSEIVDRGIRPSMKGIVQLGAAHAAAVSVLAGQRMPTRKYLESHSTNPTHCVSAYVVTNEVSKYSNRRLDEVRFGNDLEGPTLLLLDLIDSVEPPFALRVDRTSSPFFEITIPFVDDREHFNPSASFASAFEVAVFVRVN